MKRTNITHEGKVIQYTKKFSNIIHRTEGPAIIYPSGNVIYVINGIVHSFEEWCKRLEKTDEEIVQLKLQYGNN